jgi:hypothetical protein
MDLRLRLPVELPLPACGFFVVENTINDTLADHASRLVEALGCALEPLPGWNGPPGREVAVPGGRADLAFRIASGPDAGRHLYLENQNHACLSDGAHVEQVSNRLAVAGSRVVYVAQLLREVDRRALERLAQEHPGRVRVLVREEDRDRGVLILRAVTDRDVCVGGAQLYILQRACRCSKGRRSGGTAGAVASLVTAQWVRTTHTWCRQAVVSQPA